MRRLFPALTIVLAALVTVGARADDAPSPKRPVPDYDGRGPPADGANAGVWAARVALSPIYVVSEYVIRRPVDGLVDFLETNDRLTKLYDFFAFGPNHKIGFAPIGFIEFGFNPSVGVYGFWNDAGARDNTITMHVEAWPDDWLAATFSDHWRFGNDHVLELQATGVNRPDEVFYGVGPDSQQGAQSRYREARTDASATIDAHVWRSSRVRTWAGVRKVDLSDGHFGGDPSLTQEAATGAFAVPFGFNRGYAGPYGGVDLALDTRDDGDPRSGVRLEALGALGSDLQHGASGWAHYGAIATAFWDVDGCRRILSLSGGASFVDPLGDDPVPFTELVTLGDGRWMAGYFPGRLRGRSAAVAMLRYDWPIASFIDGTMQAVVGNVFDEHLDGFRPGELRFSGAIGITTNPDVVSSFAGATSAPPDGTHPARSSTGPRLQIVAGFGTDTFDRGATVQSFHIAFGVPHSF